MESIWLLNRLQLVAEKVANKARTAAVAFLTTNLALLLFSSDSFAQAAAQPAPPAWTQMVPLILMVAVAYIVMIRPQQKREKARQSFVSALKRGDEVVTATGLLGRVEGLTEQVVTLEIADGVRVKVLRSTVASSVQSMTQSAATNAGASSGGKT